MLQRVKDIFRLLVITFGCMVVAMVLIYFINSKGIDTAHLRLATVVQDCLAFIFPALAFAAMAKGRLPLSRLGLDRAPDPWFLAIALLTLVVYEPLQEAITVWNNSLTLPAALSPIEAWMRESEAAAEASIALLMGGHSIGSLIVDIVIVGLLAALAEEMWFRGALQQTLGSGAAAIWATAFIFSAIHLQFFGFFPRMLLGAWFGYQLVWGRSLWTPVIVHAVNNSIVVALMWNGRDGNLWNADAAAYPPLYAIIASALLTAAGLWMLKRRSSCVGTQSCGPDTSL